MAETFVLVHGAWHGAWCWAAVINQLQQLGDRAYAVDLPGHGMSQVDRATVTLDGCVRSVAEFIERHDLNNVVLAGHSLGGLTIPGVAAKIPNRIKRVVWVTALVALDGQPLADPADSPLAAIANARPDRSIPLEAMGEAFLKGLTSDMAPAMIDYLMTAVCPQPVAPMISPVPMKPYFDTGIPSSYLVCEDDQTPVAGAPNWHPHFSSRLKNPTLKFLKSGHEVMFTHPAECAQALHDLAIGR
ncbi:MAG: alpha/beta hydrolase [Candidatus Binatus sp.]|uniref:alpha/beta fold hydrolase n=1 Tax=Candidatus Binatus sp. TaxID=2811406 RepID=UPI00271E04F9|nr:alpha/beta hydrolase [Candidatus Binatus sp.]MDO8433913.1 alpha/beta hydrolase [Candidatus Binatus sp.]